MNATIPMYVYTTNFVADRIEAVRDRYKDDDRGASLVEYAGLIVLAVVVLGAIYAAFQAGHFQTKLGQWVGKIFNQKSVG